MAFAERVDLRRQNAVIERDDVTGLVRANISIHDQHILEAGQLVPIVENFVADGVGGYAIKAATRLKHQLRLANDGSRIWFPRKDVPGEFITLGKPAGWNGSAWIEPNLPVPTRTANHLSWNTAQFGMSLDLTWRKVKLEVILKNSAFTQISWPISLTGLTRAGRNILSNGVVIGQVDLPTARDANRVDVPITFSVASGRVILTLDTTGATYPITVDPTFTSQPDATAGIDNFLAENDADGPHGTNTELDIWLLALNRRPNLFKFDTSSIPSGAVVTSGTFHIWLSFQYLNADGDSTYTASRILSANSGWVEGATWNYANPTTVRWAGDTGANGGTDAGCSVSGTDYSSTAFGTTVVPDAEANGTEHPITMNVAEVQAMLAANHGIVLWKTSPSSTEVNGWRSSDHATSGERPKLVIVYTVPSVPKFMNDYRRRRVN